MREKIETYFKSQSIPIIMRYFDPSYIIRSVPADAEDAILCDLFARGAVHAAMAGKTGLIIGLLHDKFIHVPIEMVVKEKNGLTRTDRFGRQCWRQRDNQRFSSEVPSGLAGDFGPLYSLGGSVDRECLFILD
jgi:6-phosphofructokinase